VSPAAVRVRPYNRERLVAAMDELRLDAVIASSPWNVTYTAGVDLEVPQVTYLVTTRDGRQGLVINEADAIFMRNDADLEDIRAYPLIDDIAGAALELLAELLSDLGLESARIGIEDDFVSAAAHRRLEEVLAGATFTGGSSAFTEARIHKLPWEIDVIRRAAYSTDKAIITGFALARVGDTERDLATAIQSCALRFGARTFSHTVCSAGLQSTVVHAHPLEKPIRQGEAVHVDFGGRFEGYSIDLSRTAVVGPPIARQAFIHQTLWDAQQQMFAAIRPGVLAKEVFATGEACLERAGLSYPWATLGHSNGLLVHDGFEITRTSDRVLEAGMVLNIEPTHIEAGDARYHIEDTVLITEDGVDVLSSYYNSSEMYVIG
jgi:Xaa-Pro aminopeptidase